MKRVIKYLTIIWLVLLLLVVAGCGGKVAATVNGEKIYLSEVDEQLEQLKKQHSEIFQGAQAQEMEKRFRRTILDALIENRLVLQEARKMGIRASDAEVANRLEQMKKMFGSEEEFKNILKQQGLTEEKLKERIKESLVMEKVSRKIYKGIKVTDKEIKDYYNQNKDRFKEPRQVKLRVIVVSKKSKAERALQQLKSGADFSKLAKEESEDKGSKDAGGDVGWKTEETLGTELFKVAFSLEVGKISDVIKSGSKYYILKVEDKKDATLKSFDDVKSEIKNTLLEQKRREKYESWVGKLKSKAKIKKYI